MSSLLAGAQLTLLTWVLFATVGAAAVSLAARHILPLLHAVPPATAATRLRWLLAAPVALGFVLTLVVFSPSLLASVTGSSHHCMTHGGHHHLCLDHLPDDLGTTSGWWLLALAAAVLAARLSGVATRVVRGVHQVAPLRRLMGPGREATIASAEPICAAIGWWRPTIVVSDGFIRGVGAEAARAAIAHERAHALRRDAMWTLLGRVASVTLLPSTARLLLEAHELATERACDETAAVEVGDRLVVADAILRAQRLGLGSQGDLAAGFGPARWSARVEALLLPDPPPPAGWDRWDGKAAVALLVAAALASPLHHAAESALSLLTH